MKATSLALSSNASSFYRAEAVMVFDKVVDQIGERIRTLRQKLGLSQRQMSNTLDVSAGYLSDIENAKTKVNASVLVAIAISFPDVSTRWLLTGTGLERLATKRASEKNRLLVEQRENSLDLVALKFALDEYSLRLREATTEEQDKLIAHRAGVIAAKYEAFLSARAAAESAGAERKSAEVIAMPVARRGTSWDADESVS